MQDNAMLFDRRHMLMAASAALMVGCSRKGEGKSVTPEQPGQKLDGQNPEPVDIKTGWRVPLRLGDASVRVAAWEVDPDVWRDVRVCGCVRGLSVLGFDVVVGGVLCGGVVLCGSGEPGAVGVRAP